VAYYFDDLAVIGIVTSTSLSISTLHHLSGGEVWWTHSMHPLPTQVIRSSIRSMTPAFSPCMEKVTARAAEPHDRGKL
jgi:hypothetical protein